MNKLIALAGCLLSALSYGQTFHTVCGGPCAFTTVQAAILASAPGDTIEIRDATHLEGNIHLSTDSLHIRGQGKLATKIRAYGAPAAGPNSIFWDTLEVNVWFDDITMENGGDTTTVGGAVSLLNGNIWIDNVKFSKNNGYRGGAIAISGQGAINMDSCDFIQNKGHKYGSAIDINVGDTTMVWTNNTFTNNDATDVTTVIWAMAGARQSIYLDNCSYLQNDASVGNYGAAFGATGAFNIDLIECLFDQNTAANYGAAVNVEESNLHIYKTTFTSNETDNGLDEGIGGAIYFDSDSLLTVDSCVFSNNFARYEGGAIYLRKCPMEIANSTFVNNYSIDWMGGAIYHDGGTEQDVVVEHCTFTTNTAPLAGGAIYFETNFNGEVNLYDCTFDANETDLFGGAIGFEQEYYNLVLIDSCTFDSNISIDSLGGAIYASGYFYDTLAIRNCSFQYNVAAVSGGAIFFESDWEGPILFSNTTFDSNQADADGGALYFNWGFTEIQLQECTFTNNSTLDDGGSAYFSRVFENIEISNCEFASETAADKGAAFYFNDFCDKIEITNSTFNNGLADYGAAIYWNYMDTVTLDSCTFTGNFTNDDGGALYFARQNVSAAAVTNSSFTANTATFDGGAVYFYDQDNPENIEFENCTFENNNADYGGAILIYRDANLHLNKCAFVGNTAVQEGGAIYAFGNGNYKVEMLLDSCILDSNHAGLDGGAIFHYASNKMDCAINHCQFFDNWSDGSGGAIYYSHGSLDINRSSFHGNHADTSGGAIFNAHATDPGVTIATSTFYGNTANQNGGALYTAFELFLDNSTITQNLADADNDASGDGGGFWDGAGVIQLKNTIVAENTDNGGQYPDVYSAMASGSFGIRSVGYNMIGNVGNYNWHLNIAEDIYGDPNATTSPTAGATEFAGALSAAQVGLDVLADNGGFTPTCKIEPTSLGINSGFAIDQFSQPVSTDQRGEVVTDAKDRGAYERICQGIAIDPIPNFCESDTNEFVLTSEDTTGIWSGPGVTDSLFDPYMNSGSITVTYTILADTLCPAIDTYNFTVFPLLYAGNTNDTTVDICLDSSIINLWPLLGSPLSAGGVWRDIDASGGLSDSLLDPIGLDGIYHFEYFVAGALCGNDSATLTVTIVPCPPDTTGPPPDTTAIREQNSEIGFGIVPNPNRGQFSLFFKDASSGNYSLHIYDLQGKAIHNEIIGQAQRANKHHIDLSGVNPGVYLVQLTGEFGRSSRRVLIE